jgi:hypothetical protein
MRFMPFCVLLLSGCSQPEIQKPIKPLRDFRGIIHCHSKYSHDSKGTYEEILAAAKAAKVDFICMTDHPPSGDKVLPLYLPANTPCTGLIGLYDQLDSVGLDGVVANGLGVAIPLRTRISSARLEEALRSGHRVFLAGTLAMPVPDHPVTSPPPAYRDASGKWHGGNYFTAWDLQVAQLLTAHAARFGHLAVPIPGRAPVQEFEQLDLAVTEGWR